jgi:NitT/TauT family transport system permease protein
MWISNPVDAARSKASHGVALSRAVVLGLIIGAWELAGRFSAEQAWISSPSLIAARLTQWLTGELWLHIGTTLAEIGMGLALGVPVGIVCGLVLGQSPAIAKLTRPFIVSLYNVPLVAMAPIFILWFGLDMLPKVVLVGLVTFFLMFFNTFSGAQSVDRDLVQTLQIMGASRRELFQKVVLPASAVWILTGLKIALPYALVAATTGELMAGQRGLGFLLNQSSGQLDMTGVYAALVVLMGVGVVIGEGASWLEKHVLRWRSRAA